MTALARVARRIVRKVVKPILLRWVAWRAQRSDEYLAALADMRSNINAALRREELKRLSISARRRAIEREVA